MRLSRIVQFPFVVFIILSSALQAQNTGSIAGKVIDKLSQLPLAGASIGIEMKGSVLSDSLGVFRIGNITPGSYNVTINYVGYKPASLFNQVITTGNENFITIELEPAINTLQDVVVRSNKRSARAASLETPLSVQRLTAEEIKSNPGGNFDISKVIQALPGVGGGPQGGGFRNDIIIRGGAPNENVYYLDGIEIPVINHFQTQGSSGGPQGMLNVSFIEDVKLSSSSFDARYDNALSSVFQFKQKNGNPNQLQGNIRLSATELAGTFEGPLSSNKKTTFLFSARRSYLQLLFSALDLPIRPNYWDFQTKITSQLDKKTTLSFIGLGAIDEFKFAAVKNSSPEKSYIINSNPTINQWNYTGGISLKRLVKNGFVNLALSRNAFDNGIEQYQNNDKPVAGELVLDYKSRETENKLRLDINKSVNGFKFSWGAMTQLVQYDNHTYNVIRREFTNENGAIIQPSVKINFNSPLKSLWRYGAFAQVSKRLFGEKLGVSAGIRTDMNSFTSTGNNAIKTLSPRIALSYVLNDQWTINASIGRYFKLPPYTILGFADNNGNMLNKQAQYLQSDHLVAGIEYLPKNDLRITIEGFYKKYSNVPVSSRDGISLSNLGGDFNVLGNEAVITNGKGRAYGAEFFLQKKLTKKMFGILSYTWYKSEYTGANGKYIASSWDNRHLLSATFGYKFTRNWELGIKFRYQGGAPYTPYDNYLSQLNYLSTGRGVFNYNQLNTLRLNSFNASDIRIDKKWNFKKTTIDLFLDVTNWYVAKSEAVPYYTFTRNADNTNFVTTDGGPVKFNGSNAIPTLLLNNDASVTPTIGFIVEF